MSCIAPPQFRMFNILNLAESCTPPLRDENSGKMPIHKLNGTLGLDGGHSSVHILWHNISWNFQRHGWTEDGLQVVPVDWNPPGIQANRKHGPKDNCKLHNFFKMCLSGQFHVFVLNHWWGWTQTNFFTGNSGKDQRGVYCFNTTRWISQKPLHTEDQNRLRGTSCSRPCTCRGEDHTWPS